GLIIALSLALYWGYFYIRLAYKYVFTSEVHEYRLDLSKVKFFLRTIVTLALVLLVYENLQLAIVYLSAIDQDAAIMYYDKLLFGHSNISFLFQPYITVWL